MKIIKAANASEVKRWLKDEPGPYALDLETTGLDQWKDTITHAVIANSDSAVVIPIGSTGLSWLGPILLSLPEPLILHNYKYDFKMLIRAGVDLRGKLVQDTMLMHSLDSPDSSHALDSIVQEMWGDDYKKQFWSKCGGAIGRASEPDLVEYAGRDGIYTRRLFSQLQLKHGDSALVRHTHRLAAALFDTEIEGIRVDIPYLTDLGCTLAPLVESYRKDMDMAEEGAIMSVRLDKHAEAVKKAWTPNGKKWKTLPMPHFNWDSPQQVQALLYDKLNLLPQFKVDKKTREKRRSVDDDALAALEAFHGLPKMLRQYAEYRKVYTAFIEGTLQRMQGGRIYPNFNVNGTVTGRISSEDPNLQQLPSKGEWAKVRGIYVPDDDDSLIVSADYDQLEVVIAAHFSQDPNLLKIVLEGVSKHDITAKALGIERGMAKTLNFAMQYQCGPGRVAETLGLEMRLDSSGRKIVPQRAKQVWAQYWKTYAKEREVIDACAKQVDEGRAIVSPWGRTRLFATTYAENWHRAAAKRQAYSTLIQGTGADCTHWAYYTIAETLKKEGWGRALFEVHDQIVASVKKRHVPEATKFIEQAMVAAGKQVNLSIPLKVKVEQPGERWTK